jgi:hypothetical protein
LIYGVEELVGGWLVEKAQSSIVLTAIGTYICEMLPPLHVIPAQPVQGQEARPQSSCFSRVLVLMSTCSAAVKIAMERDECWRRRV